MKRLVRMLRTDNEQMAAHARPHGPADYRVHELRPFDKKIVALTRKLDGGEMVWRYGPTRNRLRRLASPPLDHPATLAAADTAQQET